MILTIIDHQHAPPARLGPQRCFVGLRLCVARPPTHQSGGKPKD